MQWSFYAGDDGDASRVRYDGDGAGAAGQGRRPGDSSPLWFIAGDQAYEIEVDIEADPGASAGLLLFYNRRLYAGLGFSATNFIMHSYGLDRRRPSRRTSASGCASACATTATS